MSDNRVEITASDIKNSSQRRSATEAVWWNIVRHGYEKNLAFFLLDLLNTPVAYKRNYDRRLKCVKEMEAARTAMLEQAQRFADAFAEFEKLK